MHLQPYSFLVKITCTATQYTYGYYFHTSSFNRSRIYFSGAVFLKFSVNADHSAIITFPLAVKSMQLRFFLRIGENHSCRKPLLFLCTNLKYFKTDFSKCFNLNYFIYYMPYNTIYIITHHHRVSTMTCLP
jgi:hypothetical protein